LKAEKQSITQTKDNERIKIMNMAVVTVEFNYLIQLNSKIQPTPKYSFELNGIF